MLHHASALRQCDILAADGPIGNVHDLYFDDRFWTLRYIVVDTGKWLPGRKVLIAPEAVRGLEAAEKTLSVDLTREQIEGSPETTSDLPVSRQMETALRRRFGWPEYWDIATTGMAAPPMIPPFVPKEALQDADQEGASDDDPNLRSANEIMGYGISATDDEIGHIDDLLIDDTDWVIRYTVVETGSWLSGRKVLIAPAWCRGINWSHRLLDVALSRESIETCPEYDPDIPVTREYETEIHRHYRRNAYWPDA